MRASLVFALLAAGCSCGLTHSARDGAVDDRDGTVDEEDAATGCPGPMPTDCFEFGGAGDCTPVRATCEGRTWDCPQPPPGAVCETIRPCETAFNGDLVCRRDLGAGCCGEETPRVCGGTEWECLPGSSPSTDCDETCEGCAGLSQVRCIGEPTCAPLYEDSCCAENCDPTLGCEGCQDFSYGRCALRLTACDPFQCDGEAYDGRCEDRAPDCSGATPMNEVHCSVPGCVVAIQSECSDDCESCVPLNADACEAFCDVLPPECPAGRIARAINGCYTGDCIAPILCGDL